MSARGRWFLWSLLAVVVGLLTWRGLHSENRFCWLVFGPNGEHRLLLSKTSRGWFLDRDGDGRFTGRGEALGVWERSRLVTLTNLGGVNYTLSFPRDYRDETVGERCLMEADVGVGGPTPYRQLADIGLGRSRRTAGIGHFNGPLTVQLQTVAWQLPPGLALRRGEKPTDVRALIGTVDAATRCWTTVFVMNPKGCLFPTNVFPYVEVEFPASGSGREPIHVRYPLKEFC